MTYPISDVTRRVVYSGSAGVGPYSFTFEILTENDIGVYKNAVLLTITTDYTVTINADGTGSITLVSAATESDTISIFGNKGIQRQTDFTTGGDLFANSLNDELDAQTIFAQQNSEAILRSLRAPVTDPTTINMEIPAKADRLGSVLAFDDTTGDPIAGPTVSDVETVFDAIGADLYVFNTGDTINGDLTITGNLTVQGSTTSIDSASVQTVDLGDNDKIRLGDGNDLQLYHDGTESIIEGNLRLQGSTIEIKGDYDTPTARYWPYLSISDTGGTTYIKEGNGSRLYTEAFDHYWYTNYPTKVNAFQISYQNNIVIYDQSGNEAARFRAGTNDTKLGIGTSNAAAPLEIASDATQTGAYTAALFTHNGSTATDDSIQLKFGLTNPSSTSRLPLITAKKSNLWTSTTSTQDGKLILSGITDGSAVDVLEVNGSGIDVTGSITSDDLTVDGTPATITLNNTNTAINNEVIGKISFYTNDTSSNGTGEAVKIECHAPAEWESSTTTNGEVNLDFYTTDNISGTKYLRKRMEISYYGDILFYEDTGSAAKLIWDASDELLNFQDGAKATFGASDDLQIYHDGTRSYVDDTGAGSLWLRGGDVAIMSTADESMATFANNGSAKIYYDGSEKLATTSTGIDVTGTVTADGLTVDGTASISSSAAAPILTHESTHPSGIPLLDLKGASAAQIRYNNAGTIESRISFSDSISNLTYDGTSLKERLKIANNGDISFYEDTGTTAKFFWDASAERLGIGRSDASFNLHVDGNAQVNKTAAGTQQALQLNNSDTSAGTQAVKLGFSSSSVTKASINAAVYGNDYMTFNVGSDTERMRIDSSGNLLVGKTTSYAYSNGVEARANGYLTASRDSAEPLLLNRTTTDGTLALFAKDGTTVGSIGVNSSKAYVGTGDTGLMFDNGNNRIDPVWVTNGGSIQNGILDLGGSTSRFKDLYLSGKASADTYQFAQNSSAIGATEAIYRPTTGHIAFKANSSERMRIDSSGNLLVGTASTGATQAENGSYSTSSGQYVARSDEGTVVYINKRTNNGNAIAFFRDTTLVGSISVTTSSTSYNTSSDYRLKTDVQPMTGATERLKALNPVNFEWISSGERVDGFLAHEAQEVVPEAVTGTKDAVDAEGNPEYQGIDQSKLVPLLVATIQEQQAVIESLTARIEALEN